MKKLIVFLILINAIRALSQGNYTVFLIEKNRFDSSICKVSGTIEHGESLSIYLKSETKQYWTVADTNNSFDFGFIDTGIYLVKIQSDLFHGTRPDVTHYIDKIKLENGVIYDLRIHERKLRKDSCCIAGWRFILPVYFEIGFDTIPESIENKRVLEDLNNILKQNPRLKIEIGVHFDDRYPKEDSRCHSCAKANNIKKYMVRLGINPERIVAKGYEGFNPYFLDAKTEEQDQWNRQINVTVLPPE